MIKKIDRSKAEIVARMVDRLMTVEIRNGDRDDRDIIPQLYDRACKKLKGKPISLAAAESMLSRIRPGDAVVLVTGFAYEPYYPYGENDGPLGIASLARAVRVGLGAVPLIVVGEADMVPSCRTVQAAGLTILDYGRAKAAHIATAAAITFPVGTPKESAQFARDLFDKYAPKAALSVETVGPNKVGVKHSGSGRNIETVSRLPGVEHLFYEASRRGILTIGCIDGGNEIGSGAIEAEVRRLRVRGNKCGCPCRSGVACAVKTDIVFPASVSNWGAYGISAMLGYLLNKREILQDACTERRMLEACISAGGVDGELGQTVLSCDGVDHIAGEGLIALLHTILRTGLIGV